METADRIAAYVKQIEGISYLDWIKLRHVTDRLFERQKNEQERHLQLVLAEDSDKFIHSVTT